jgi:hypothetical protein
MCCVVRCLVCYILLCGDVEEKVVSVDGEASTHTSPTTTLTGTITMVGCGKPSDTAGLDLKVL